MVGIGPGFLPLSMGITGTTLFASDWPVPGQPWLRICWLRPFPTRFPGEAVLRVMGVMGNCRDFRSPRVMEILVILPREVHLDLWKGVMGVDESIATCANSYFLN